MVGWDIYIRICIYCPVYYMLGDMGGNVRFVNTPLFLVDFVGHPAQSIRALDYDRLFFSRGNTRFGVR
jgi:hypothetical protein